MTNSTDTGKCKSRKGTQIHTQGDFLFKYFVICRIHRKDTVVEDKLFGRVDFKKTTHINIHVKDRRDRERERG